MPGLGITPDDIYLELVRHILTNGSPRTNRTGVDTLSVFGYQMRFDLTAGFPLLTTKRIHFAKIYHELMWFLRGDTNVNTLKAPEIWSPWADEDGECGPIYGAQWRNWDGDPFWDQIAKLIDGLKNNPDSRRHIVTAWNPSKLDDMALPPCHCFFQCNVSDGNLDLHLYQRSADVPIGVPYNIASYALLTHMLAWECGLKPRHFIHSLGDAHIYVNQIDGIHQQLSRKPRISPLLSKPEFTFAELIQRDDPKDVGLLDYNPHPFIKMPVAV